MSAIFSIGHSNHSWERFRALLEMHKLGAVADVRSHPYSRWAHFNRPSLQDRLNGIGIAYLHLPELGGRPSGGCTTYDEMARTREFVGGLEQVLAIASRTTLGLLCSEGEVIECHRCLLVGRRLKESGADLRHILRSGEIETHEATEQRLIRLATRSDDLFASGTDRLDRAYRTQELRLQTGVRRR